MLSQVLKQLLSRRPIFFIVVLYLTSLLVHFPQDSEQFSGLPHVSFGQLSLGPPLVLSGDSPHYLVSISSLVNDWDFDLSNNYEAAERGGLDAGILFRGREIDHHADTDRQGREVGTHSPFFALFLALVLWPLGGSPWLEPAAILLTTLAALVALKIWFQRIELSTRQQLWTLGLASPLWCYAGDLWTEPWVALCWVGLLAFSNPLAAAAFGFIGSLIKYPFIVVPLVFGLVAWKRGERRRACWLLLATGLAGVSIFSTVQLLFWEVDHFSFFHSGIHGGFQLPFSGSLGLLFSPTSGLFLFFPVFLFCWKRGWKDPILWLPALAFFLVHASYQDWGGGTAFSSRYMVPLLPILALGMRDWRAVWYHLILLYSLFWGFVGGFFPAIVYDRSPWGAVTHVVAQGAQWWH